MITKEVTEMIAYLKEHMSVEIKRVPNGYNYSYGGKLELIIKINGESICKTDIPETI